MSIVVLPSPINIPAAWFGGELAKQPDIWHYTLQDEEIHELISAASKFCASGEELWRINQQNFVFNNFELACNTLSLIFCLSLKKIKYSSLHIVVTLSDG